MTSHLTSESIKNILENIKPMRLDLNTGLALLDSADPDPQTCLRIFTLLSKINRIFSGENFPAIQAAYAISAEAIQSISLAEIPVEKSLQLIFEILNQVDEFFEQIESDPSRFSEQHSQAISEQMEKITQKTKNLEIFLNNIWEEDTKKNIGNFRESRDKEDLEKLSSTHNALPNVDKIQSSHEKIKIDEKDLIKDFLTSSTEILSAVEDNLLILESSPGNDSVINEIFRGIHTLKGDSGFLRLSDIQTLSHAFETLLGKCRNKVITIDQEKISLFLLVLDTIKKMVKNISLQLGVLTKEISKAEFEDIDIVEPLQKLQVVIQGGSLSSLQESGKQDGTGVQITKTTESLLTDAIRVPQKKIEDAEEMVGELMIALSLLKQNSFLRDSQDREATEKLDQMELVIELLQNNILKMKMFPIGSIFNKLSRTVRDLAPKLGKKINFEATGSEVEIDKSLIDQIHSPLAHIIRNCIDHGIESPGDRLKKGKSDTGSIRLKVENIADNVSIEIADDGRGLNRERIISKAIEKRIIESGKDLSESQIDNLIFTPGFSTSEQVTEISGRGVGMDVVRTTIEQFGGSISLSSILDQGTTMKIRLPLSSSIIEGLVTNIGTSKFIFPIIKILYTLIPNLNSFQFAIGERGLYIIFENKTTPIICLGEYYDIADYIKTPEKAVILIVEHNDKYYGIMVDDILHRQKVVSKSFKNRFNSVPGLKSGTILGDGSVGFIIEPNELVREYYYE